MYFYVYVDAQKLWRWNLRAANHRIIADSAESYNKLDDCLNGIKLVKSTTTSTPVFTPDLKKPGELLTIG